MAKVLVTISDCRNCEHSILFLSKDAKFSILACGKTERVLKIVHENEPCDCDIPDGCPLPDFVEPKTD